MLCDGWGITLIEFFDTEEFGRWNRKSVEAWQIDHFQRHALFI